MRAFRTLTPFLLPLAFSLVASASTSDYTGWRQSDGTPQSVMLSYYNGPDTRGFAWQTATSVSSGALWLLKGEWDSSTGNFDTNQVATASSAKQTDCYTHKAHVTGLAVGTWSYRLGTASHYAYGRFEVRDRTKPFVAINITDIQLQSADKLSNWKNVVRGADAILSDGKNADTIISCGDFFDSGNSSGCSSYVCWGVTADQARDEFADVAWTMVSGNHDGSYYSKCCAENYNSAASSGGGCHSYDYGAVHVATIPYASSLSTDVESWLKADLAAAQDAQWRILVMHFGPYTTADHGQSAGSSYVQKISGICAQYKVDLVLQGHDHTYSKTLPYRWSGNGYTSSATDSAAINLSPATVDIDGETYYDNPEGTVYVSAGCAGDRVGENASIALSGYASRSPKIVCDKINVTSSYAKQGDNGSLSVAAPMFAVLTADESTLKYDWYVAASATPELFDTLRISKAPPEPPPSIETMFNGAVVTTVGAVIDATDPSGDLILVYTNTAAPGSLTLQQEESARILVVGGGGGGASGKKGSNRYYGDGGSGGQGVDKSVALPAGSYAITIGKGGAGILGGTSDPEIKQGEDGTASKFAAASGTSGFEALEGPGGAKGGDTSHKNTSSSAGAAGFGVSGITGEDVVYGAAGAGAVYSSSDAEGSKPGADGTAGTGAGGGGAGCNSMSGAGASGIVVVRISGFGEVTPGPDDPVDPPGGEPAKFCVTPYLQRPSTDAMTIIFFTDSACTATVEAWPANAAGTPRLRETTKGVWAQALTNNVYQLGRGEEKNKWNNSLYKHRVRFEGLKPNRIYNYTVTLDGGAAYSNTFRTAPDRDTPIRFVSYADCETTSGHFANYTANLQKMQSRNPDLITTGGDLTARGGIQSHWDEFWMQNAGGNGIGYTDILGSIPMITPIGNHDLFDNVAHSTSGWYHDAQGEFATEKFLSYFEFNSNNVPYKVRDGTNIPETRDMSQLFHREDYGPVTLIFLDTNNGKDCKDQAEDEKTSSNGIHDQDTNYCKYDNKNHQPGGMNRWKGARHPDFNPGSPQYDWLTNQLADAQQKSRFTFVFNHHCPYSVGGHNTSWSGGEDASALAVRVLTETMVRYGVDGWYCGHDELLEHSITNGYEILPNGSRRKHTLSIYDLGCSGDSARNSSGADNPLKYWQGSGNYGGTGSYGFLETDVTTNKLGQWTCTITPVQGSTGNYLSAQVVYVENQDRGEEVNDLVYAEYAKTKSIPGVSSTKPSDWLAWEKPPESADEPEPGPEYRVEEPSFVTMTKIAYAHRQQTGEQCKGFLTVPGREYAWGKAGKAKTEWVKGDGTPCELKKPDGDGWELMVR